MGSTVGLRRTMKSKSLIELDTIKRRLRMKDTVHDHNFFILWLLDVYRQSPPNSCSTDTIKTFQRRAVSYLDLDKLL
jgi:hypothetical protein